VVIGGRFVNLWAKAPRHRHHDRGRRKPQGRREVMRHVPSESCRSRSVGLSVISCRTPTFTHWWWDGAISSTDACQSFHYLEVKG